MIHDYKNIINQAYDAFNARDIDKVLSFMNQDVHWPNGWEGGYVEGHSEVREYWTRQWKEIDPNVKPISFEENERGQIEVTFNLSDKQFASGVYFVSIRTENQRFKKRLIIAK